MQIALLKTANETLQPSNQQPAGCALRSADQMQQTTV